MPPLSKYTPFESLLFFQSLATSDVRPASFASISKLLSSNPFVRENVAFDADRLSPEALEDLYATLMRDGFDRDTAVGSNGRSTESSGASNPKKRKISNPRPGGLVDGVTHATLVPELVSHLYAKYRELVTKEIREDERRYTEIREEIERLQREEGKSPGRRATEAGAAQTAKAEHAELMEVDVKEETPRSDQPEVSKPLEETVPLAQEEQAPTEQPHPKPAQPKEQPPAQPQTPGLPPETRKAPGQPHVPSVNGQVSQPPLSPQAHQAATAAPAAHPSQIAPRANVPVPSPGTSVPQPSFQQWQLDPSPHSPYPNISSNAATPQAGQATVKRPLPPLSTQQPQAPLPSTIPGTPGSIPPAAQTPVPIGRPHISQTPSATLPSFPESRSSRPRLSIDTPGSSTPWRRTPRLSIPQSPTSPERPRPEDVSPISERAPSPTDTIHTSPPDTRRRNHRARSPESKKTRRSAAATDTDHQATPNTKTEKASTSRRKRTVSSASSQSRGQSVASRDESSMPPEDTEREPRTGRRKGAATTDEQAKARSKRKRAISESIEQETFLAEPSKVDTSQYVMCMRNFHRTAAMIMNDVATHKLASIFAKPIAERDAPGYHDLIYRPQDLKTIKSAITQGSKAVAAATEAVSTPAGDGESPAPAAGTPSKSAVLMLQKTEDIIPPKGIVNSAQLEKELIRMFANAIMFNPIPQRGFGPAFPMTSDHDSRESTQAPDEGGIIQDSLEMFNDVEQGVTRWRAAERNPDELANKSVLTLRRGSASDFNTDSADDAKG
ncbi:hypothetical protein NUU61_010131 [Penicillium alfredii]|uniref:Bromo domain-containing protein n=1 Tax=Penicillium alfredii TaxID=1506179 RepID=A0A9W9EHD6_9EURO|nr:uncharacterized protein NUU61_010131 [Penicillium alfredii]KAJ5081867.1 hypothetical protein NUU61_010131 [Penicillium alfredii]